MRARRSNTYTDTYPYPDTHAQTHTYTKGAANSTSSALAALTFAWPVCVIADANSFHLNVKRTLDTLWRFQLKRPAIQKSLRIRQNEKTIWLHR